MYKRTASRTNQTLSQTLIRLEPIETYLPCFPVLSAWVNHNLFWLLAAFLWAKHILCSFWLLLLASAHSRLLPPIFIEANAENSVMYVVLYML